MQQRIQFVARYWKIRLDLAFWLRNAFSLLRMIEINVFIILIYIPKQHHVEWSGIGTFSFKEGCQWVIEPVSRHFFINQNLLKGVDFYLDISK